MKINMPALGWSALGGKRILISLSIVVAVAAVVVSATTSYFSDEEKSTNNTFTAGTIDIEVNKAGVLWSESGKYELADMKPSQVDYTNFTIRNTGTNPVNVWKKVSDVRTEENGTNEPELAWYTANQGQLTGSPLAKNNIDSVIKYDLSVVVKNVGGIAQWNQTLYNENKTITDIANQGGYGTFLGMIPVGWSMDVTESYHMDKDTGNWAQSDKMTFDITVTAEQLTGTAVLENKDQAAPWRVLGDDGYKGTLTYGVKDSKFNYSFAGKVLLVSTNYSLIVYAEPFSTPTSGVWPRPVVILGSALSDTSGNVSIPSTSLELNANLLNAKVWLIESAKLTGNTLGTWDTSVETNTLFDTGLIDYYDTDL